MPFATLLKNNKFLLVFCIVCCALNFIAYYPGFLSIDSLYQYGQVVMGRYDDWHPPIMAIFWHLLYQIHPGPSLMLLFQLCCLWASAFLLLQTFENILWRVLVILMLFSPVVQNFAGYIIKDNEMALCWLLAFSIMFRAIAGQRKMTIAEGFFSFIFLTYGTWIRANALPGLLPLCFLWVSALLYGQSNLNKILLTAAMSVFIFGSQLLVNNTLIKPEKKYQENKLFLQDLTGIFVKTGQNVYPPILYNNPDFDTTDLRKRYDPVTFDHIWWNKDFKVTIIRPQNDTMERSLFQAWKGAICSYPAVYLRNRMDGFLYYLRIKKSKHPFVSYYMGIADNDFGFKYHRNIVSDLFVFPVIFQKSMPYMRPWFWFFLNLLLPVFASAIRDRRTRLGYNVLVWSGIFYVLPSFFVYQTDTDFRYFYWNCVSCLLAIILLIYQLTSRNNKPSTAIDI